MSDQGNETSESTILQRGRSSSDEPPSLPVRSEGATSKGTIGGDIHWTTSFRRMVGMLSCFVLVASTFVPDKVPHVVYALHIMMLIVSPLLFLPEVVGTARAWRRAIGSSFSRERERVLFNHVIAGLLMFGFVVVAIAFMSWSRWARGKKHFNSFHGQIGIAFAVPCIIQAATGTALYFRPRLVKGKHRVIRYMKSVHWYAAFLTMVLAPIAFYTALNTNFARRNVDGEFLRTVLSYIMIPLLAAAYFLR